MRGPHNIIRLIRTGATFERTGAMNLVLDAFETPKPLRILAHTLGWPFKWLGYRGDPAMPPATRALTALGPAYIKFGQVLSTRPDVVGSELAQQLRVLQDQLPPFSRAEAMAEVEANRADGIDAVAIVTPNHMHAAPCIAFLKRGIHVICDKPLAATMEQAKSIARAAQESSAQFFLTHNYTGYPMIRQAQAMVAAGELGDLRVVQVECSTAHLVVFNLFALVRLCRSRPGGSGKPACEYESNRCMQCAPM